MFGKPSRRQWLAAWLGGLLGLRGRRVSAAPAREAAPPSARSSGPGVGPASCPPPTGTTTFTYYLAAGLCIIRDEQGRVTVRPFDPDWRGVPCGTFVYETPRDPPETA